jgi:hypothetical protein
VSSTVVDRPSSGPPRLPIWIVLLGAGAILGGLVAGQLVHGGRAVVVPALALVLLPIVLWKKPAVAPPLMLVVALTVEQFPEAVGASPGGWTAHVPLYHGMGGVRPSDLLCLLMIAIYLGRRGSEAVAWRPRTALAKSVIVFVCVVAFSVLYGIATGGAKSPALTEARPYLYLGTAYLVASTFVTTRRVARAVLWAFVIGTGLKACQGLYIFLSVRSMNPRPESVLGHEESIFFALYILFAIALWLFQIHGRIRTVTFVFLPIVIAADLANARRVAWLILVAGLIVLIVIGFATLPRRRTVLRRLVIGLVVFSSVYFPAYWNKTGGFAQPARAFHSAISPDQRDALSNLYRVQEDANLKLDIHNTGALGTGFGHRIVYSLPIEDISDVDPYIIYVPHNGVLYLFLRMGILGAAAFWSMLGVGIVAACRLAKERDRNVALVGTLVACALPAYALIGYNDQGFFYYRVAVFVGILLGLVEAEARLVRPRRSAQAATEPSAEPTGEGPS